MAFMVISMLSSCIKDDIYPGPDQILSGAIIDSSTGQPLQTEAGTSNTFIRVWELSWNNGEGVTSQDYNVQRDGTYINTKVFTGRYRIYPSGGPFVPLVYTSSTTGLEVDNGSKTVDIKGGTTNVNFTVDPFLKVEWVAEPVVNADKTVTVQVRFTRGTTDVSRQFSVTDAYLYVGTTDLVGNNSFNNLLSQQLNYTVAPYTSTTVPVNGILYGGSGNPDLGRTVSITTKAPLGADRQYYVRVGVRTADNVNKRYNYNAPKLVNIPK
ncbi:Protein of unknown function [Pedobacter sp. ok626]|nr:Protein of unknown function [Pedobacter sp. ok626]